MAFCTKCGKQLAEGAKFCFECGAKVNEPSSSRVEYRKIVYDGQIHKCPNCGEVLSSFLANCPACGFEIRGVSNSVAVQEFAYKLAATELLQEKIVIIMNFPIPNTKEDIVEFLILASTNCENAQGVDLIDAWMAKLSQCMQKAKMIVVDDGLRRIQDYYSEAMKKAKRHRRTLKLKSLVRGQYENQYKSKSKNRLGGSCSSALVTIIFKNLSVLAALLFFFLTVRIDAMGDNVYGALYVLIGAIFLILSTLLVFRKNATYGDILIVIVGTILTFYCKGKMSETNGAVAILAVVLSVMILIPAFIKKMFQK